MMSNLTKIKFRYLIIGCLLFALLVALVMVKVTDMLNDPLRNKQIVKSFDNDRVLILQDKQGNLSVGYRLNEEECGIKIYELNMAQDNDNWQDGLTDEEYQQREIPIKQVIDVDSLEMTYDAKYEHFYTFQDNNNTYSMTIHLCDASVFSFNRRKDY